MCLVNCDEGSLLKCLASKVEDSDNITTDGVWHGVLDADLKHTRTECASGSEQGAEVHIVREEDEVVIPGPNEKRKIRGPGIADFTPVNAFKTFLCEEGNPQRRQVHVDEELHGRGNSVSCVRHAA